MFLNSSNENGIEEYEALTTHLVRLATLFAFHNLTSYNLWSTMEDLVQHGLEQQNSEVWKPSLLCCHYSILWNFRLSQLSPTMLQKRLNSHRKLCITAMVEHTEMAKEAFTSLCDLLLLLGHMQPPAHKTSVFLKIDRNTIDQMVQFLETKVLPPAIDENQEMLSYQRSMFATFCKLITNNIFPVSSFVPILRRMTSIQNHLGDIVSNVIDELKRTSFSLCSRLIVQTLSSGLLEMGLVQRDSEEMASLRDLARKLCLALGPVSRSEKEALVDLHRQGIEMATAQPGERGELLLLHLLEDFIPGLVTKDRKVNL